MKYSKKFKLSCIMIGDCSIGKVAKIRQVPKQTIAKWIRLYEKLGEKGLEKKKPGAKEKPIDPKIEETILRLWEQKNRSAYKMRKDIKNKNYNISKRKIYQIYEKHGLKSLVKKSFGFNI